MLVNDDRWRDALKFLMGLGVNPSLSTTDQKKLSEVLRGPFANGMSQAEATRFLRENLGWVVTHGRPDEKIQVGTVDLTPKWIELLPLMLHHMQNGTDEQRALLRPEFEKMARIADSYNATVKAISEKNKQFANDLVKLGKKP
jgi:hypothetical protein